MTRWQQFRAGLIEGLPFTLHSFDWEALGFLAALLLEATTVAVIFALVERVIG